MPHYSYTRISEFEACPYRYDLKYNKKKVEPESDVLVVGSICHEIIEKYSRHLIKTKQSSDFEILPSIVEEVLTARKRYDLADEVTDIITKFSRSFMIHLDTIYDVEFKFGLNRDLKYIGWPSEPSGWNLIFFAGIIDRIDIINPTHIRITDYKAGWNTDVDNFQLQLYAMALSRIFSEVKEFTIELDFIRYGIQKSMSLYPADAERAKKRLFKIVNEIESTTDFRPTPGSACKYCGFLSECPAMRNAFEEPVDGEIFFEDQARKVAGEILVLEAQLEARRKALQKWVKAKGPIKYNGLVFGYQVKESEEIRSINNLIQALEAAGSNLEEYLSVSAANKKKLKKDYPELYEELKSIKKSTRWGVVKEEVLV